ncbi:hypothetical protein F4782DRAFT_516811 [Xylaria castorea]|nr:hypothetical protein F4782DRAFT_516811 [Xylaria castorea]
MAFRPTCHAGTLMVRWCWGTRHHTPQPVLMKEQELSPVEQMQPIADTHIIIRLGKAGNIYFIVEAATNSEYYLA